MLQSVRSTADPNILGEWLSWGRVPKSLDGKTVGVEGIDGIDLVTAAYELSDIEDNLFLRWLLNDEEGSDVRSRLANVLTNSNLMTSKQYDLVIMDAPPRLSLASVNALRATDFVIVPSKLQPLSSKPVRRMIRYLNDFKSRIKADFKIAGVVCSMTRNSNGASGNETSAYNEIKDAFGDLDYQPKIFRQFVPDRVPIGRPAGASIGYLLPGFEGDGVRDIFDRLSDEIAQEIGLKFLVANAAE